MLSLLDSQPQQQSLPLVDDDVTVIRAWLLQVAISSLLYGVNAILSILALYLFLKQGISKSKPRLSLFTFIIFMLTFSTASLSLNLEWFLLQIKLFSYNPPDITKISQNISIGINFMERVNFLASDGIVVWRAVTIFPHSSFVKIILGLCMLGSCVGCLVDAGLGAARVLKDNGPGNRLDLLEIAVPLLATNSAAIAFIGYKAWCHHQDIKKNLSSCESSINRVQKILWILVESGMVYWVIWITYTMIALLTSPLSLVFSIFGDFMPFISAIYPTFIVLMVALEKSQHDQRIKAGYALSLSQSMRFASRPREAGANLPSQVSGMEEMESNE